MDMDFYTLDSAEDNVLPTYYVSTSTLFEPSSAAIIKDGFPIFTNSFGENHGAKSFDQDTATFEDTVIKAIAKWDSAPLFEIKTTSGRTLEVSPEQLLLCVRSDYSEEGLFDQFYENSISTGLDETTSIVVKNGDGYKIDGVQEVNFIGEKPVYYVLSAGGNFVLSNGAVLINY